MFRILSAATVAMAIAFADNFITPASTETEASVATASRTAYGNAVSLGKGKVRSYVLYDATGKIPQEVGVAFDERAMDSLPSKGSGHHDGHMETHEFILQLPAQHGTPFKFVELNWNPMGHEPAGVYQDVPHFDFHFYTISKAERDGIVPTDPQFAAKANNIPTGDFVPPFNVALGPPGAKPADLAVPMMGVHWVDVRSEELQAMLGKPEAYKPFRATFIHGSWNGQFHFWEPMVTRAHILSKRNATDPAERDQVIPISTPAKYQVPGYYPTAYRVSWDAAAKEYRVALTKLVSR